MYVHVASAHGPKTVSGLEEAVGHQPPAHAHNFSCLAGVVWAKKPWVLQWPRALSAHAPPHKFRTFPCLRHGPLSMPQNASEHSLPHHHQPPWPNGQGAGLLIRRLWSISLAARTQCLLPARTHHATWHTDSFLLVSHLSSHCGSHWFTVLSHLQLVSSMAKKQASQSPKNIPKHKLVEP